MGGGGAEEEAGEVCRCQQCQRDGSVCQLHRYHVQQAAMLLLPAPGGGAGGVGVGDTLGEAAIHGRLDAVERLLAAGADPNDTGQFFAECTPLFWAVYYGRQRRSGEYFGRRDVEVYSQSAGAFLPGTVSSADSETGTLTVEYTDSGDGLRRGLRKNTAETAHGDGRAVACSPGATKFKVITPKNSACLRRRSIVGMLLDSGANPTWSHPRGGTTPLHVAAERGDIHALELLLEHPKADPNVEDQYRTAPLAYAAQWGHTECQAALIKAGARPSLDSAHSATGDNDNVHFDSLLGAQAQRKRRYKEIMARRAQEKADAEAKLRLEACRAWVCFGIAMGVVEKWQDRPLTEVEQQQLRIEEAELRAEEEREQAHRALEEKELAMEEARAMEAQAEREKREAEAAQRALQIEEDEAQRAMQEAKAQQDVADDATVRELSAFENLKAALLWKKQTEQSLERARGALADATEKNRAKCAKKVVEQQTIDEKAARELESAQEHYDKAKLEADIERQKSVGLMSQADKERADAETAKVKFEQEQREARDAEAIASEKANEAYQLRERALREQRESEEAREKLAKAKEQLVLDEDKAKVDAILGIHLHDELQNRQQQEEKAERERQEAEQAAMDAGREEKEAQEAEEKAKHDRQEAEKAQQYATREQVEADLAHEAVREQREAVSKAEVQVQSRIHVRKTEEFRVQHFKTVLDNVEDAKSHHDRRSPTRIKQDRKKAKDDLTEAKRRCASAVQDYDKAQEDLQKEQQLLMEKIEFMSKEDREAEKAAIEASTKAHEAKLAQRLSHKEAEEAKQAIAKKEREQQEADEAQRNAKEAAAIAMKQARKKFKSVGALEKQRKRQWRLEKEKQEREFRAAEERSEELLKAELIETHKMDEESYEYIKDKMKQWQEANRSLDIKLEDLIAAWVYSMGPGGAAPNFCDCGYKPPKEKSVTEAAREAFNEIDSDGSGTASCAELAELCRSGAGPQGKALSDITVKRAMIEMDTDGSGEVEFLEFEQWWKDNAGSCTCQPNATNFRIYDKLNSAMRVIHSPNEPVPEFKWLSYHLANAVGYIPGAKELDGGRVEPLYRGQGANAYGGPFWSVSEKCRPPNGETCDSSCTKCYKRGDTVVWNAYTSTSTDRTAAEEFAGKDGVLFEIVGARPNLGACFATTPPLSAWPDEAEILLPAGATFKVLSRLKKPGERTHVTLEHLGEWLPPSVSTAQRLLQQCASCCGGSSNKYEETPSDDIEKPGSSADGPSISTRQYQKIHIDRSGRRESLVFGDPRTAIKLGAEKKDKPLKFELVREHSLPEECFDAIARQVDEHRHTESAKELNLAREDWVAAWLYSASTKPESPECAVIEKFLESMRRREAQTEFKNLCRGLRNAAHGLPQAPKERKLYRGDEDFTAADRKHYQQGQKVCWMDFRATTLERAKAVSDAGMSGVLFEILERPADRLVNAGFSKALPLPSDLKSDDEFVIAAGATFEVAKVVPPKSSSPGSDRGAMVATIVLKFVGMGADTQTDANISDAAVVKFIHATRTVQTVMRMKLTEDNADDSASENGEVDLDPGVELPPQPEADPLG